MDYRERFGPHEEGLRLAMQGNQVSLWTAMPGVIQSFNTDKPNTITAVITLSVIGVTQNSEGTYSNQPPIQLYDVPVVFPRGGGCSLTFPLKSGDECLVVFAARCIDSWWQSGGVNNVPMEPRLHDLSDGFCIPGPYSQPNVISNISTTDVQLRSNDGNAFIGLNPTIHNITINTTGNVGATISGTLSANVTGNSTLTTPLLTLNGNMQVNGTITSTKTITSGADIVSSVVTSLNAHVHGGVQSGGSNTSGPTG
jgi:phage baseplate assembly protein gpV